MMRSRPLQRSLIVLVVVFGISLYVINLRTPQNLQHEPEAILPLRERLDKHDAELLNIKQKQIEISQLLQDLKDQPVLKGEKAVSATQAADDILTTLFEKPLPIAVLMLGCNRPDAVKRSLTRLLNLRPSAEKFPVIVSLDCAHSLTEEAVLQFGDKVKLIKQPDQGPVPMEDVPVGKRNLLMGYYKISRHYRFALEEVFDMMKYETVIIVEDDLDLADDFFELMAGTEPLLHRDSSLWCVSAWNDNGKASFIDSTASEKLYRTDFFPGLGWMMKKNIWEELGEKWPKTYWDDWMRNPEQRKGRACIRPEISRTFTFGDKGVSRGQFWRQHLQYIQLNKAKVEFSKLDLSYLTKEKYDEAFLGTVYSAPLKSYNDMVSGAQGPARVEYRNNVEFKMLAKKFQIMDDLRAGVPRMAYQGIVPFMYRSQQIYLSPPSSWKGYVV